MVDNRKTIAGLTQTMAGLTQTMAGLTNPEIAQTMQDLRRKRTDYREQWQINQSRNSHRRISARGTRSRDHHRTILYVKP